METTDIQKIALFFFYSILDEKRTIESASQAYSFYSSLSKKEPHLPKNILLIKSVSKVWENIKTKVYRGRPQFSYDAGWTFFKNTDLGPWIEFQKKASDELLMAVVYSHILKFTDSEISQALGLSEGTIRYRVGRGLSYLGSMIDAQTQLPPESKRKIEVVK